MSLIFRSSWKIWCQPGVMSRWYGASALKILAKVVELGPFRWTQVEDQVNPVNPGSPWLFVGFFPEDRKEVVVKTLRKGCFLSSAPWQIHQDGSVFSAVHLMCWRCSFVHLYKTTVGGSSSLNRWDGRMLWKNYVVGFNNMAFWAIFFHHFHLIEFG